MGKFFKKQVIQDRSQSEIWDSVLDKAEFISVDISLAEIAEEGEKIEIILK